MKIAFLVARRVVTQLLLLLSGAVTVSVVIYSSVLCRCVSLGVVSSVSTQQLP